MSFWEELKRRNVLRVGLAYLAGAWLLIQIVETLFPVFGLGDATIRVVAIVLAIGFVPVLVLSWVFELTPQGLIRESEVDRSESVTRETGKKLDRTIMLVLALAVGYFAFDKFVLSPQREADLVESATQAGIERALEEERERDALIRHESIAVLPFVDISADEDQEYFSDGISEELLNLLSKVKELRVISRTSAFSYKNKDVDIPTIAAQLNVAHVLEGSVRKSGDRVRITAQLIDARSDTHLWSETYDRTLNDIFAIQDEIAAMVVSQLKITLLGDAPRVQETDLEAYSLFLRAHHISQRFTADALENAVALYRQALDIDPDYTNARVGLAGIYINQATNGTLPFDEGFRLAREAADRALAVDPEHAVAHAHLGWIAMWHDQDLVAAARHYERALALEPADLATIGNAALLLKGLGRLDEAVPLVEYQTARDPVNPTAHYNLGLSYLSAGRWDGAIESQRTALTLSPDYIGAHSFIGTALLMRGEFEAALESMQLESFEAYRLLGLVMVHHALGQTDASDAALAELIEKYEQGWAYNIAYVLSYRNDADRAFEWLEKAVEYGDPGLADIVAEILFRNLHLDPRWTQFLERIGKAPEQLRVIEFDMTLPE